MEGGGFQGYMFSSLLIGRKIQNLFCLLLFDIATCNCTDVKFIFNKILQLWKLSPSTYQLLTQHLDACAWKIAVCHPSIQYTILHALYTYCQR